MKTKKKEVYLIDCPHCDSFDAETWDKVEEHITLVHATTYEKACRGDYVPKLDYKADREAYRLDQQRLNALFQQDLEVEYGVQDNPKKDQLFNIAWGQGHSSGWAEVALHYGDFVVLIK